MSCRRNWSGCRHDERVSSCELHWSGLSDWAVLSDEKQRVENCDGTRVQCRTSGTANRCSIRTTCSCTVPASQRRTGLVRSRDGLRAWQIVVWRWDPSIWLGTAKALLELFQFDIQGDVLAKLETFERGVSQCDMSSGETLSDNMRVDEQNDTS